MSLIRHAEKPSGSGPPAGVTVDGVADPESLTVQGWQRAGALIGLFDRSDGPIARPGRLIASQVGPHSSSKRPEETLAPLAARLGLSIDTSVLKEDISGAVRLILASEGPVLVAWEHHLIPSIANLIVGDTSTVPQTWPDDRFDIVWVFDETPGTAGAAGNPRFTFRQVPQLLMGGDQATPIGPEPASG